MLSALVALPSAAAVPSQDNERALAPARRAALERSLVAQLSILREDRGVPPLEWDPRLALTLREYLADMLERGWDGGPPISTPAGKATVRAKQRHRHTVAEVFDNFSPQQRADFSVEVVAEAMISAELMASFRDPNNRLAAAAIVEGDKGVFSCIAVAAGDPDAQAERSGQAAAAWLAALGSRGAARADALKAHLPDRCAEAVPWLLHLIQTDRDPALRAAVVRALGRSGTTSAVQPLITQLSRSKGAARGEIAEALSGLTGQAHGEDAKAWVGWWADVGERFVLPAITDNGPLSTPTPVSAKEALAGFKKALKSKDPALRVIACRGIGHTRDPKAASSLAKLLGDPEDEVRRSAATAFGTLGAPGGVAKLKGAWKRLAATPRLARAAVGALGGIQDKKAVSLLVDLLPMLGRAGKGTSDAGYGALRALTGHDAGSDPGAWKKWWRKAKSGFVFPSTEAPEAAPAEGEGK